MPREILMPALTPTMEEGTLARWHVRPGDSVEPGQVIAEIETDKSVLELEALEGGEIGELMVEEGAEGVAVDRVIATVLEPQESSDFEEADPGPPTELADETVASGIGRPESGSPSKPRSQVTASTPAIPSPGGRRNRVPASSAARRLARERGVDISALTGTGPRGRIVAADVEAALSALSSDGGSTAIPATGTQPPTDLKIPFEERPLSTLGRTMARRMAESKANIPHFHCSIDVCVDAALSLRAELNASGDNPKLSLNDLVVHAVARALRDTPRMNVQYRDDRLIRFRHVDIAVAVALDEGLVTPVLRGAETLPLTELTSRMRDLTERARARQLGVEDYLGGTFTVSNVGMFGIRQSWPIINPPHAGTLGVGAAVPRPVAIAGEGGARVGVATMMTLTLAADHRVVDGSVAGKFLRRLKNVLEAPQRSG